MQTCPECGKQTEGVNHNGRGPRCAWCWARLPVGATEALPEGAAMVVAVEKETPTRSHPVEGPEYSPPAQAEARPEIKKKGKG